MRMKHESFEIRFFVIVLNVALLVLLATMAEWLCRFCLRNVMRRYSNLPNSRIIFTVHEKLRRWLPAEVEYAVNREGERGMPLPKCKSLYRSYFREAALRSAPSYLGRTLLAAILRCCLTLLMRLSLWASTQHMLAWSPTRN